MLGKAARGVTRDAAPLPDYPLVLECPLAFWSDTREGWCRLRLYALRQEEEGLLMWTVRLWQESGNDGWPLAQAEVAAASAAWQCLVRRRDGDWPIKGDARLESLPFHPSQMQWIVEVEGQPARALAFEWEEGTPRFSKEDSKV